MTAVISDDRETLEVLCRACGVAPQAIDDVIHRARCSGAKVSVSWLMSLKAARPHLFERDALGGR